MRTAIATVICCNNCQRRHTNSRCHTDNCRRADSASSHATSGSSSRGCAGSGRCGASSTRRCLGPVCCFRGSKRSWRRQHEGHKDCRKLVVRHYGNKSGKLSLYDDDGETLEYKDGKFIAGGYNHVLANHDPSAHGEVQAIREACRVLGTWDLSGCVLYTSCEPCPMCLMTSKWANIGKIYFAATRKDAADIGFKDDELYALLKDGVYGIAIEECRGEAVDVMKKWHRKFGRDGQY